MVWLKIKMKKTMILMIVGTNRLIFDNNIIY